MKVKACLLALILPLPALSATLGEEDAMLINRVSATDFEVVETRSMAAADFWCGAATYVERRNQMSERTLIYVKRARGPAETATGRNAVLFTTDPNGLPAHNERLTLSVEIPGAMLKSVKARRYCRDAFTRSTK